VLSKRIKRRLGVNLDHVATLRQARREGFPNPLDCLCVLEECGVDQVTLHVREDRRHMCEDDLAAFIRQEKLPVNLEMAGTSEMLALALKYKPKTCTLVPEKREEITTEGGLDLVTHQASLLKIIQSLKKSGIIVSLFIDPDKEQIRMANGLGADAIEIHTGTYARNFNMTGHELELGRILKATTLATGNGLKVFAGHGLDTINLPPLVRIAEIEEYNIGFSIIARSIMVGLKQAILEIQQVLHGNP